MHKCAAQVDSSDEYFARSLQLAIEATQRERQRSLDIGETASELKTMFNTADTALSEDLRINKYIIGLSGALKQEATNDALLFFDLLKTNGHHFDPSLQFYYGKTLINTGKTDVGLKQLNGYVSEVGREGQHYAEALALIMESRD